MESGQIMFSKKWMQSVHQIVHQRHLPKILAMNDPVPVRLSGHENKNGGGGENRTRVQRNREASHYKFSSVFIQFLAARWLRPERPSGIAIMS